MHGKYALQLRMALLRSYNTCLFVPERLSLAMVATAMLSLLLVGRAFPKKRSILDSYLSKCRGIAVKMAFDARHLAQSYTLAPRLDLTG